MSNDFKCPLCLERGKTWEGSDPVCSFTSDGVFTNAGWNCATMNKLREIATKGDLWNVSGDAYRYATRNEDNSIGVVYDGDYGFIVMTWYKDRGRTGMAVWMCDEDNPSLLKLEIAKQAIEFQEGASKGLK